MNDAVIAAKQPTHSIAFAKLLLRLRGDGDAGIAYEALRRRLIGYFRAHAPVEAAELADLAIDRLARRVDEGVEIASVPHYALGIARLILLELRARQVREQHIQSDPTLWIVDPTDESDQAQARATAALEQCLREAGNAARALILDYYADGGSARIGTRKRIAETLGISVNALRNRALRLRDALEACVRRRVGKPGS